MRYDAIVIGSGLSGLVAALELQRAQLDVLVIERRSQLGGLCGTHSLDGFEFGVGCGDFGTGLVRTLRELGVAQRFKRARCRFVREQRSFELPPDWRQLLKWLPQLPDLLRLAWAMRRSGDGYLTSLLGPEVRSKQVYELVEALSLATAAPPDQLQVKALREELHGRWRYGYQRPVVPVGGPGALIAALARAFRAAGGTIELGVACERLERHNDETAVHSPAGSFVGRAVLTSQGRWDDYPQRLKPGLAAGFLHLAVNQQLAFPAELSLAHLPTGAGDALAQLEAGHAAAAAPVLLSRRGIPAHEGHYTLTATALMPRGQDTATEAQSKALEEKLLDCAERLLPGLRRELIYSRFLSPAEFTELHGLSSRPTPFILPPGVQKLDVYDPARGVYFLGNSVGPPGNHAGAAVLSGRWAAQRARASLRGAYTP